jgi:hypothetical protein
MFRVPSLYAFFVTRALPASVLGLADFRHGCLCRIAADGWIRRRSDEPIMDHIWQPEQSPMPRTPGSGKPSGTPNRITAAFNDAVRTVYQDIGGDAAFAEWARANRGDFYRIASRMIPTELNVRAAPVQYNVVVNRAGALSRAAIGATMRAHRSDESSVCFRVFLRGLQGAQ